MCGQLSSWRCNDTVGQRITDISAIINDLFGQQEVDDWQTYASSFPVGTTLEELRDFLWADTDEQQAALLKTVHERLNLPIPACGLLPPRVRVMTMHGAKGLSAHVVFIPGLEEETLPGHWRRPYPGLVLEAARLLYVSITRARASCIVSYARTRVVNGEYDRRTPSRFCAQLGGAFSHRINGLTSQEIQQIIQICNNL